MSPQGNDYDLTNDTVPFHTKISKGAQMIKEFFPKACIYRVPRELRKLKKSAYTPQLVSIGPLHSDNKHLTPAMQDIKMSYVDSLFSRISGSENEQIKVLKECLQEMKLSVEDAKKCYTEQVDNLNEEMLVLDGCFILELLYRFNGYLTTNPKEKTNESKEITYRCSILELLNGCLAKNSKEKTNVAREEITNEKRKEKSSDPIFGSSLTRITIQHDLLLLENQLPFFVLEKLFGLTVDKIRYRSPALSLIGYVVLYFDSMRRGLEGISITSNGTKYCSLPEECVLPLCWNPDKVYKHILHILHDHHLPPDLPVGKGPRKIMPSASKLDYAGVKFAASGTGQDLFKVNFTQHESFVWRCFHRAQFEIPTLHIYHSTEAFLRNLIAFEQCCPGDVLRYFTSYAILMDMLVNSEKDVSVLEKAGIIHNYLGTDEDASDLFNKLLKEIDVGEFFFAETCKQAIEYSKHCWPATVGHVRSQYFATPWTFIAFVIAFIAFGMTVANFVRLSLK